MGQHINAFPICEFEACASITVKHNACISKPQDIIKELAI